MKLFLFIGLLFNLFFVVTATNGAGLNLAAAIICLAALLVSND